MFISRAWNRFALGRSTVEFNGVTAALVPSTFGLCVIRGDIEIM